MIDPTLQERILEAPFIIRGFVNDEPECNYECYLTEMINNSKLFLCKSKGTLYRWREHQDHGECDAVSDNYSVDFKLLATKSSLHGLSVTSGKITKIRDGSYAFGIGRWPTGQQFKAIRTVAALRKYSVDDLIRIAGAPIEQIETEVSIILKSLRVKKNLLLFYPYTMSFSEPHSFIEGCNSISDAFNEDLNNICKYRIKEVPLFDTFLCTIYDQKLLVFQETSGQWELKDSVEVSTSNIYMDLFYTYGNNGFNF